MREIKFRAFIKWAKLILEVESIDFKRKRVYCKTELEKPNPCDFYNFDDIELMQYTGLKDKNGVEIYEGDSVKFIPSGEYGLVTTFGNSQNQGIEWENSRTAFFTPMFYLGCETELEIIGNIYENPELLTQ